MDKINQRSFVLQNTLYAFILSLFFPLLGISADLISSNELQFTLEGVRALYSNNPLHWIVLQAIIILPLISYYFSNKYVRDISRKQAQLDFLSGKMNKINHFTQKLIEDDYTQAFDIEGDADSLGKSLINLRDTLKRNNEAQEKRRKEDEQRNWIAEGLARFGDILRTNNDNLEHLSFIVIKELVKYINAIQGSFYMLNNDDPNYIFFDQTALFAYERKKFADKKIKWGDGLVGTCAIERQPIYMTKIPESYVNITSGLGKSNPKCLLLVPLISENELYGVIELASFNPLSQHELNFVERVAENIAATIASVRTNVR
ncbi:MAG: GAF domain-containing protein, partial [Bacteroidales bacterium]